MAAKYLSNSSGSHPGSNEISPPTSAGSRESSASSIRSSGSHRNRQLLKSYHEFAMHIFSNNTGVQEAERLFLAAVREGDYERVENFLKRKNHELVNIDVKDLSSGDTPLISACRNGFAKVVQLLLKFGADTTLRNYDDETAISVSSVPICKLLLESVERSGCSHRHLLQAAWQGNGAIVDRLLKEGKFLDINCENADGLTPLLLVTRDIMVFEKVKSLLKDYSPDDVVRMLLAHRADPSLSDSEGKTPMHYAAASPSVVGREITIMLMKNKELMVAQDENCVAPIHVASRHGQVDVVVALLDKGVDVNSRGHAGSTPLHVSASAGQLNVADTLLDRGADVTLVDDRGNTPMDVAHSKKMKMKLREAWAEVTQSRKGSTPSLSPVKPPSRKEHRRHSSSEDTSPRDIELPLSLTTNRVLQKLKDAHQALLNENQVLRDIENGRFTPSSLTSTKMNLQKHSRRRSMSPSKAPAPPKTPRGGEDQKNVTSSGQKARRTLSYDDKTSSSRVKEMKGHQKLGNRYSDPTENRRHNKAALPVAVLGLDWDETADTRYGHPGRLHHREGISPTSHSDIPKRLTVDISSNPSFQQVTDICSGYLRKGSKPLLSSEGDSQHSLPEVSPAHPSSGTHRSVFFETNQINRTTPSPFLERLHGFLGTAMLPKTNPILEEVIVDIDEEQQKTLSVMSVDSPISPRRSTFTNPPLSGLESSEMEPRSPQQRIGSLAVTKFNIEMSRVNQLKESSDSGQGSSRSTNSRASTISTPSPLMGDGDGSPSRHQGGLKRSLHLHSIDGDSGIPLPSLGKEIVRRVDRVHTLEDRNFRLVNSHQRRKSEDALSVVSVSSSIKTADICGQRISLSNTLKEESEVGSSPEQSLKDPSNVKGCIHSQMETHAMKGTKQESSNAGKIKQTNEKGGVSRITGGIVGMRNASNIENSGISKTVSHPVSSVTASHPVKIIDVKDYVTHDRAKEAVFEDITADVKHLSGNKQGIVREVKQIHGHKQGIVKEEKQIHGNKQGKPLKTTDSTVCQNRDKLNSLGTEMTKQSSSDDGFKNMGVQLKKCDNMKGKKKMIENRMENLSREERGGVKVNPSGSSSGSSSGQTEKAKFQKVTEDSDSMKVDQKVEKSGSTVVSKVEQSLQTVSVTETKVQGKESLQKANVTTPSTTKQSEKTDQIVQDKSAIKSKNIKESRAVLAAGKNELCSNRNLTDQRQAVRKSQDTSHSVRTDLAETAAQQVSSSSKGSGVRSEVKSHDGATHMKNKSEKDRFQRGFVTDERKVVGMIPDLEKSKTPLRHESMKDTKQKENMPVQAHTQNNQSGSQQCNPNFSHQNTPKVSQQSTPKASQKSTPKASQQSTPKASQQSTPKASQQRTQKVSQQNTPKVFQQSTTKVSQQNTSKVSQQNALNSSQQNTTDTSQQNASKVSQQNTSKVSQQNTPKASQQNTPKVSQQKSPEVSQQSTPQVSQQNTPKVSQQKTVKVSQQNIPKVSQQNTPKVSQQNTPKVSQQNTPKVSQQKTVKVSQQNIPKVSQQNIPKVSQQDTPKVSQQNTPKVSQQKTVKVSQQNIPKVSQQNIPKLSQQDTPKVSQQNTPKFSQQKTVKVSQQNTPKVSQQNTPKVSQQKTPTVSQQNTHRGKIPMPVSKPTGKKRESGKVIAPLATDDLSDLTMDLNSRHSDSLESIEEVLDEVIFSSSSESGKSNSPERSTGTRQGDDKSTPRAAGKQVTSGTTVADPAVVITKSENSSLKNKSTNMILKGPKNPKKGALGSKRFISKDVEKPPGKDSSGKSAPGKKKDSAKVSTSDKSKITKETATDDITKVSGVASQGHTPVIIDIRDDLPECPAVNSSTVGGLSLKKTQNYPDKKKSTLQQLSKKISRGSLKTSNLVEKASNSVKSVRKNSKNSSKVNRNLKEAKEAKEGSKPQWKGKRKEAKGGLRITSDSESGTTAFITGQGWEIKTSCNESNAVIIQDGDSHSVEQSLQQRKLSPANSLKIDFLAKRTPMSPETINNIANIMSPLESNAPKFIPDTMDTIKEFAGSLSSVDEEKCTAVFTFSPVGSPNNCTQGLKTTEEVSIPGKCAPALIQDPQTPDSAFLPPHTEDVPSLTSDYKTNPDLLKVFCIPNHFESASSTPRSASPINEKETSSDDISTEKMQIIHTAKEGIKTPRKLINVVHKPHASSKFGLSKSMRESLKRRQSAPADLPTSDEDSSDADSCASSFKNRMRLLADISDVGSDDSSVDGKELSRSQQDIVGGNKSETTLIEDSANTKSGIEGQIKINHQEFNDEGKFESASKEQLLTEHVQTISIKTLQEFNSILSNSEEVNVTSPLAPPPLSSRPISRESLYSRARTQSSLNQSLPLSEATEGLDLPVHDQFRQDTRLSGELTSTLSSAASVGDRSHSQSTNLSESDGELLQWKKGNILGKGAFGTVFCGLTNTGQLIAVKRVELTEKRQAGEQYEKLQEEVELLKTLRHKNIVGFLGVSLEESVVNIFMQYIPGGSIASLLARFGALEEPVFCRYTYQVVEGTVYLHSNNVIHRDIKGANIMLMSNGVIKLIDFGCAKRLCIQISQSQNLLKSMKGTPYWMAPEVVMETGHGTKSDVWSIGCTVMEMATGKPPWADMPPMSAIFAIGSGGPVPQLTDKFSKAARDFVDLCLTRDPNDRATSRELLQHPFLKQRKERRKESRLNSRTSLSNFEEGIMFKEQPILKDTSESSRKKRMYEDFD